VRIEAQRDRAEPGVVRIAVSDTGCGVAPELSSHVFERLYQASPTPTQRSGLGLGLHICKELVTLQGGRISMTSRPLGAGTTVAFTVPIVSLEHVLAPLAPDGQWPAASLAVVTVVVRGTPGNRSRDPWTEWVHEARALIERCLIPERHVLLPRPPRSGADERFFIAAFTDEAGASALASRIAADFARMRVSLWPGMTVSVAHHMAGLPAAAGADSTETPWRRMASHLGRSLAGGDDARGRPR
jgi:hypothetical protein